MRGRWRVYCTTGFGLRSTGTGRPEVWALGLSSSEPDRETTVGSASSHPASSLRHTSAVGNTGYTTGVAKVMVSLPDDLLRAVDMEAGRRGTTRSGYLRELAEQTLRGRSAHRAKRMAEIDAMAGPVKGHGGSVAALVKVNRPEQ